MIPLTSPARGILLGAAVSSLLWVGVIAALVWLGREQWAR